MARTLRVHRHPKWHSRSGCVQRSLHTSALVQEGHFLTTTDARAALDGAAKPTQPVVISRPSALDPRRQVRYEVVDKAPSTGSERWERVVAVVCLGKKWQFRGYPFKVCILPL